MSLCAGMKFSFLLNVFVRWCLINQWNGKTNCRVGAEKFIFQTFLSQRSKIYLILDSFPLALFTYMLFSMLLRQQRTKKKQLKNYDKIEDSTSNWCKYSA